MSPVRVCNVLQNSSGIYEIIIYDTVENSFLDTANFFYDKNMCIFEKMVYASHTIRYVNYCNKVLNVSCYFVSVFQFFFSRLLLIVLV